MAYSQVTFLQLVNGMVLGEETRFKVTYCEMEEFEVWVKKNAIPVKMLRQARLQNRKYKEFDMIHYRVEKIKEGTKIDGVE